MGEMRRVGKVAADNSNTGILPLDTGPLTGGVVAKNRLPISRADTGRLPYWWHRRPRL